MYTNFFIPTNACSVMTPVWDWLAQGTQLEALLS